MKIIKFILAIVLVCKSAYSFSQACHSIEAYKWILGNWFADNGKTIIYESWKKVSPHTYEGNGESISKSSGKHLSSESLRIVDMSNELFYVAKPEQNDLPVAFKLTHCTSSSVVFENPSHDFPQKLEYQLNAENNMTVIVSGEKGNSFSINFVRP